MRFGSLFSGIGGFDLGFECAGMECAWQCEIDPHAQKVLSKHFGVEVYDDVRGIGRKTGTVDLICGGFPCQDVSIAGNRQGLAGERSGLWFEFARVIDELEPQWVVIENVPGLLSSNKGQDFAVIVQWLAERGYGVVWRVLDAQYFGVPQRRRRVFIVGSFGNGRAAEVLFESESGARNTPPSREAGEGTADTTIINLANSGANQNNVKQSSVMDTLDTWGSFAVAPKHDADIRGRLVVDTFTIRSGKDGGGKGYLGQESLPMTLGGQQQYLSTFTRQRSDKYKAGDIVDTMSHASEAYRESGDVSPTLQARMGTGGNQVPLVGVRRLTPTECERLQGFPDGWTDEQSDTQRYKQLGNAVAVPVAEWIGRRIVDLESV